MSVVRCYALNADGHISAREDVTSDDLSDAIQEGWRFVTSGPTKYDEATGLEIWQGGRMLFSSNEAAAPGRSVTIVDPRSMHRIPVHPARGGE